MSKLQLVQDTQQVVTVTALDEDSAREAAVDRVRGSYPESLLKARIVTIWSVSPERWQAVVSTKQYRYA